MASTEPSSERQLTEIGRIVRNFASLEWTAKLGIWTMLTVGQKDWEALTAPLSFKQALDVLSSLHKLRHPKLTSRAATFENLRKKAEDAETVRNEVVHSVWATSTESGALKQLRITARGKTGVRENLVEGRDISSVESLNAIAQEIFETNRALSNYLGLAKSSKLHFDRPPEKQD
jgi:hypothetical protein